MRVSKDFSGNPRFLPNQKYVLSPTEFPPSYNFFIPKCEIQVSKNGTGAANKIRLIHGSAQSDRTGTIVSQDGKVELHIQTEVSSVYATTDIKTKYKGPKSSLSFS